jgi:hypothetical protein
MLRKLILATLGGTRSVADHQKAGFALPLAMMLGLIMLAIAGTSLLVAQGDRNNAVQRKTSGASLLVSDSAVSRALLELNKPNNGVLLIRNYDPIDPKTGKNYLGADGASKSGDESTTAIDQWTGYDPSGAPCFQQLGRSAPNIALTGTIGTNETYTIRAYRYDKQNQQGTLLVEGNYKGQTSWVAVTLSITPILDDFPGILIEHPFANGNTNEGKMILRGRVISGPKGNVYYPPDTSGNPTLTGSSAPGDFTRSSYLDAIFSSQSQDGATADTVSGKIFACTLKPTWPISVQGTDLGNVTDSMTLTGTANSITYYQVSTINLNSNSTLTINTTEGPVYLYFKGNGSIDQNTINLRNTSKIINIRTDGRPPRVGDLRIMTNNHNHIALYDQSCIQDAFIYLPVDPIEFFTSGGGCPASSNNNFVGVAWVEAIKSSKNSPSNRIVSYPDSNTSFNSIVTTNAKSGITVPDDVSSLNDLLEYVDWPARYRYGSIKNWQRVN